MKIETLIYLKKLMSVLLQVDQSSCCSAAEGVIVSGTTATTKVPSTAFSISQSNK